MEDFGEKFDKGIYNVAPLLNIIYPRCALQARYSEYHTFHVQLRGNSIYYIIPPSSHDYFHPYPYSHPLSQKQSQVFIVSISAR
jgi:hypothetical protein